MAQCEHVDEDGRQCGRHAMALSGDGLCYFHSPTVSAEERRASRSKGGRSSRKVEVLDVGDVPEIETALDLKAFYNSVLQWLITSKVNPSQARALVSVGGALRDAIELELVEILANRLALVEGDQAKMLQGGEAWQVESSDTYSDS